jgi:putative membrane protein
MMIAPLWLRVFFATVGYTVFGIVVFALAFWMFVRMSPFSIRKELEEDQNVALAIVIGAVIIGLSLIISATVHG